MSHSSGNDNRGLVLEMEDLELQESKQAYRSAKSSNSSARRAQSSGTDSGSAASTASVASTASAAGGATVDQADVSEAVEAANNGDAASADAVAGSSSATSSSSVGSASTAAGAAGTAETEIDEFAPLAARLRPRTLEEYIGQSHLLGYGKPLRQALSNHRCYSMILWGPPGVGKTTLAYIIASSADAILEQISAVESGAAEIKRVMERARYRRRQGRRTILFVDEIHRFNKAQQDLFLPYVEDGTVIFIGATTENPSFQVNSALLSRARVYVLKKLTPEELDKLINFALSSPRGLGARNLVLGDKVRQGLIDLSDGDARHLLTTLEMLADDAAPLKDGTSIITYAMLGAVAGRRLISYDKNGDAYYDLISAFHKSVRGSAPDAALYWYARILEAGGDPLYVARRLLAIATEDIGLADPQAMQVGLNAWDIFQRVGATEGERAIAEAAVYMALAPKSNHLYNAFHKARADASQLPSFAVPLYLRNAPTKLMAELGYNLGYRYAHDYPHAYAAAECFMPEELDGRTYYEPSERGYEHYLGERQHYLQQLDALAPAKERRYPLSHQETMHKQMARYHPDLFAAAEEPSFASSHHVAGYQQAASSSPRTSSALSQDKAAPAGSAMAAPVSAAHVSTAPSGAMLEAVTLGNRATPVVSASYAHGPIAQTSAYPTSEGQSYPGKRQSGYSHMGQQLLVSPLPQTVAPQNLVALQTMAPPPSMGHQPTMAAAPQTMVPSPTMVPSRMSSPMMSAPIMSPQIMSHPRLELGIAPHGPARDAPAPGSYAPAVPAPGTMPDYGQMGMPSQGMPSQGVLAQGVPNQGGPKTNGNGALSPRQDYGVSQSGYEGSQSSYESRQQRYESHQAGYDASLVPQSPGQGQPPLAQAKVQGQPPLAQAKVQGQPPLAQAQETQPFSPSQGMPPLPQSQGAQLLPSEQHSRQDGSLLGTQTGTQAGTPVPYPEGAPYLPPEPGSSSSS